MKRDMELIREILLEIENNDDVVKRPLREDSIPVVAYHLRLLTEAGLIDGVRIDENHTTGELTWFLVPVPRLTWFGHEFLDSARDQSTWDEAKNRLAKAGKSMKTVALSVLSSLLVEISKHQLGL